uniref:Allyl alcohol dehydrogenase-like protein n=1 Tax=Kalanchoe fedtschenkoi TaxID=63787 RepID=A0A7N0UVR1_KALFE
MGILSWWKGSAPSDTKPAPPLKSESKPEQPAAPGMNGAVEVPRSDITVFEFGSVASTADKVTLAGYCPVSDELEPCRWELLPASDSDAPQFRVVF